MVEAECVARSCVPSGPGVARRVDRVHQTHV